MEEKRKIKCFVCHNLRHERLGGIFVSMEREDLKHKKKTIKWRQIDGTECEQTVYECKDCVMMGKELGIDE
jgi:Pyruvate/2-oxoacid:ferredoxin oxidoreductase delta subunit